MQQNKHLKKALIVLICVVGTLFIPIILWERHNNVCADFQILPIRQIAKECDWDNLCLNRRILSISNDAFLKEWKHRRYLSDFSVIGDYLVSDALMPHNGFERSILCYNPKTNKLSVAYRTCDDYMSDTGKWYVATEEDIFPLEICKVVDYSFLTDSLCSFTKFSNSNNDDSLTEMSTFMECLYAKEYSKALKEVERNYDSTCIVNLNVWDSVQKVRFVEFRDYIFSKSQHKFYKSILLQCINVSKKMFYDVETLGTGVWWPTCSLVFDDGFTSMEWTIKAYNQLNINYEYDSELAKCYYDLAVYKMENLDFLNVDTRDSIKSHFRNSYRFYTRVGSDRTIAILNKLGIEYQMEKDYTMAMQYFIQSLEMAEKCYGVSSFEYVSVIDNLRALYYALGDTQKGEIYAKKYVDIVNELLKNGILDKNYDFMLSDIFPPNLQNEIYNDKQAEQEHCIYKECRSLSIKNKKIYSIIDYYKKNEKLSKVYDLYNELLDADNDNVYIMDSLASVCRKLGDVNNEEKFHLLQLRYRKSDYYMATALLDLSEFYKYAGDTINANKYADKAMQMALDNSDNYLFEYNVVMKRCGEHAMWAKRHNLALYLFYNIIQRKKNNYGIGYENTQKAEDIEPIVNCYLSMGDTLAANREIDNIIALGAMPDGVNVLNYKFIGSFYERIGHSLDAIKFYNDGKLYDELERILWKLKDYGKAFQFITKHFDSIKSSINNKIICERESEREVIWRKNSLYLTNTLPKYCYEAYPYISKYSELAYDYALFSKGFLLTTSRIIKNVILSSDDDILKRRWRELLILQDMMAQPINNDSLLKIQERANYIERQILTMNSSLFKYSQKESITCNEVRKALKSNEVSIEFLSVPLSNDSIVYCALVLRKNSKYPTMIPLFEEKSIIPLINSKNDRMIDGSYSYDRYGNILFDKIWSRILPYLKIGDTVYFAPFGILNQIAIEALPYDKAHIVADMFTLVRLSSTREIVTDRGKRQYSSATLYGGMQYDMSNDELLAESKYYITEKLLASRGLENDTVDRGIVGPLSESKNEVNSIMRILKQNAIDVSLFTSNAASEESFKAISGKHQNILHIATHGFYWSADKAKNNDYFSQRKSMNNMNVLAESISEPLNRCGLIFSGANTALAGKSATLPDGVQDGVLTAKEISLLDLSDANLVVLSACDTGKGDITGEGVYGLQRAFKQAGAQTIIMSLWPVKDEPTQFLMTEFYRNWITYHQSKRIAFRNAQNAVRNKYVKPSCWAAFVMMD